jgi:hypothetical protein
MALKCAFGKVVSRSTKVIRGLSVRLTVNTDVRIASNRLKSSVQATTFLIMLPIADEFSTETWRWFRGSRRFEYLPFPDRILS